MSFWSWLGVGVGVVWYLAYLRDLRRGIDREQVYVNPLRPVRTYMRRWMQ